MRKRIPFFGLLLIPAMLWGQNSFTSTGGDAVGSGGSVSYSIGQLADGSATGTNASITEGVQQPFEIFIITEINDDFSNLNLTVFPNPTTDKIELTIENNNGQEFTCILFDLQGKTLICESFAGSSVKLETSSLPAGTYILKVLCGNEEVQSFKIIKN